MYITEIYIPKAYVIISPYSKFMLLPLGGGVSLLFLKYVLRSVQNTCSQEKSGRVVKWL